MPDNVSIRTLAETDAADWWQIRFEALELEPLAFGKALAEHRETAIETVASRFRETTANNFTLGAFVNDGLIGIATLASRHSPETSGSKNATKGTFMASM